MDTCFYVVKMENLEMILHLTKETLFYQIGHKFSLNGELLVDSKLTKKDLNVHLPRTCDMHKIKYICVFIECVGHGSKIFLQF